MDADGVAARGQRDGLERLRSVPIDRCERAAARLERADLVTLARFASPPHALIHHMVAVLQTVLLSLSIVHQSSHGLGIPPWPLLRLDVLTNHDTIWRKLGTRLARIRRPLNDPRRKPLAPAQVRFVLDFVLLSPLLEDIKDVLDVLEAVGRVSAIAESIASYVLLCAYYSVLPMPIASPSKGMLLAPAFPVACSSPKRQQSAEAVDRVSATSTRTWRCGVKYHGRFFLLRARVTESLTVSGDVSALALDCRHAVSQWEQAVSASSPRNRRRDNAFAGSWMTTAPVPTGVARRALQTSATTASLSLLFQTSEALALFRPPLLGWLDLRSCEDSEAQFFMHVIVVSTETDAVTHETTLKLAAIGELQMRETESTLSDVRKQLVACGSRTRCQDQLSLSAFRFLAGDRLVRIEDEPWRYATDLLPFMIVCVDGSFPHRRAKARDKPWRPWISSLAELSRLVGSALAKSISPQSSIPLASPLAISLYSLDQTIASLSSSSSFSSSVSSTIDTLLALFVDWSAFVQFQQLQDSSTILRTHRSPQKPKIPPAIFVDSIDTEQGLRPEPTAAELEVLSLPHQPFRSEHEYVRPLYATFTYRSRHKAYLSSPILTDVVAVLTAASDASPIRFAVENAECVIHVLGISRREPTRLVVQCARDRSCPVEMLKTMRGVFVWVLTPLNTESPPRWLRDVLRFVTHPKWDFLEQPHISSWPFPGRFFHVDVPYFAIEQIVEATLWSRAIDWWPHWQTCDVEQVLLRPKYDAMCRSYPAFISIDSVKFSKLLRECGLQPAHLSVGDAAFLFTTHRAPGSHYEMLYDGFVNAMRWIARRVPQTRNARDATDQLRIFCFECLLRAPGMDDIWQQLVDQWRRTEKLRYMEKAAIEYCAATRIRANWKQFVTRRALIATLARLKKERRAAAKLQSTHKMRKARRYFVELRACVLWTQRFLRARQELRQLRLERAQLVEKMRLRLQNWMRQRLRVLRCWKAINAAWLARRARILEKRSRLVCAGVYQIESQRYRVSLYRTPPSASWAAAAEPQLQDAEYELEVLEPRTSSFRSIRVTEATLETLEHEAKTDLSMAKPITAHERKRWRLLVLLQRLQFKTRRFNCTNERQSSKRNRLESLPLPSDCVVQIHRDPTDTSLGRLIYQGNAQEHSFYPSSTSPPSARFIRLHLRSHDFTLVMYSPSSSSKHRIAFTVGFVYRLLSHAHWHGFALPDSSGGAADEMVARSFVVDALGTLPAVRLLLRYLACHGTRLATSDIMPAAIEEQDREQREREKHECRARHQREVALVIMVQSATRRAMAIRHVQRLAQRSYTKAIDPTLRRLVYKYRRIHDVLTYETKPHSLRDQDAAAPVDEWLLNEDAASPETRYFNPLRGVFSKINDVQAAIALQRWFRRTMWTRGFPPWDLRCLSLALLFHHHVHASKDLSDPQALEQITNYALQRHLIFHDYKVASSQYEAALKLAPDHVPALVGHAVLLIYSCKYPVKQTWPRALELLATAKRVNPSLSTSLSEIEQNCFRWATFLHPKNAEAFGNYAVFLQCVRGALDHAEVVYRRAIDLDPTNEHVLENYLRLQRERTPEGIYSTAGPSKIAVWRAEERRRLTNKDWRELEDGGARFPSAAHFFQNVRTGIWTWTLPTDD